MKTHILRALVESAHIISDVAIARTDAESREPKRGLQVDSIMIRSQAEQALREFETWARHKTMTREARQQANVCGLHLKTLAMQDGKPHPILLREAIDALAKLNIMLGNTR